MAIDKIIYEKTQYHINRVAAKISALSSGKFHKCEYLSDEEILPSHQSRTIRQAKFTYSPLWKINWRTTKKASRSFTSFKA